MSCKLCGTLHLYTSGCMHLVENIASFRQQIGKLVSKSFQHNYFSAGKQLFTGLLLILLLLVSYFEGSNSSYSFMTLLAGKNQ